MSAAAPVAPHHAPVLVERVVDLLAVRPGGRYVDGTVGLGGHSQAIAAAGGQVLGIDLDPAALAAAERALASSRSVRLVRGDFSDLLSLASAHGWPSVDGILLDLGLCSLHVDDPERGFSFTSLVPPDMRFDPEAPLTAADLTNELTEEELARLIRRGGEEPAARAIARAIVAHRPITSASFLAEVVAGAVGRRRRDIHPATRTFQALRLAVNQELDRLHAVLPQTLDLLAPGGRLVVIAYHSLEDREVKQFLQRESRDCICPAGLPDCMCGHRATLRLLTRHPERPDAGEVARNRRARSARLRSAERLPVRGRELARGLGGEASPPEAGAEGGVS
ncbi:MAG: 16S rRNA (cytosine(1402)-N(4))-methyltransferase RsmH [Chloroflexi bacterium]|nr:16S rRNA (cytosine(1402)-N(4))-methyltransferase RsmH [Chloroflexota bacterium]